MNIYVGNLPYDVTEDEIRDTFSEFGQISKVNIITDRDSGRSKGFGFVEMFDNQEANSAIESLHDSNLKGRNIIVNEARPREERPRRNNHKKRY